MYDITKTDELQVLADRVIYENDYDKNDHLSIAKKITEITGKKVSVETIAELMKLDIFDEFDEDMLLITRHANVSY